MEKETKKIINDLKILGIEVVKSPMGYYGIKTKKYTKEELIKEVQRMLLNNDYSVLCAKKIGDYIKNNLETSKDAIGRILNTKEGDNSSQA